MEFLPYVIIAIVALIVLVVAAGYVKSPPDIAFIISGLKKEPKVLVGRAGIRIPFFERKDTLLIKQITVDIKTNGYIPTRDFIGVDIDAVAKVRIMTDKEGIKLAMKNFLNMREDKIASALTDSLQGNMREIIGTVELRELCTDRKRFGDEVQTKAQLDMNALGIEIISCNIQKIEDEKGLIPALGQDNMSKIQKDASIAKANADKEVAIAEAEARRLANDAKIASDTAIAERENELAIKQAELKKAADIKLAEADAAYEIQKEEQRKTIEITTANANIARQEREIELKQKEVSVTEQQLEAQIKKKAEAEKFARLQQADADLYERQKKAEAERFEKEQEALARKAQAEADMYAKVKEAEGIKAVGEAEAAAIAAKGIAEAEAIDKKAEAMKKYGQAAMTEMIVNKLPEMAKAIAEPLNSIDKVTIIDGGNGTTGVGQMGGYVPTVLAKTIESIKETTGFDITDVMRADTYDAKVNKNINVKGLENARNVKVEKINVDVE
ncbi:MAG: flotillin family protein [Lachnospiraceae bacterium]|nr:flotillin family protein [Lachnospiraceae bacterium]